MKKSLLAALLATGVAGSAFAGSTGDLILGFRDDGSDGGSGATLNVAVDLGNFSQYTAGGVDATGSTVDLGINLSTTLESTYGSGALTDTGLYYGIVGTNGNTVSTRTLYVSAGATGESPLGTGNSTPWTIASKTSQSSQAGNFVTLETSLTSPTGFGGVSVTPTSASTSWSAIEANTAGLSFGAYSTPLFEEVAPGGSAVDLYAMNPQSSGPGVGNPGVLVGTFSITSGGELDFTSVAAIPEPSTYAAILGAAVLAVALIRRRQNSLAL